MSSLPAIRTLQHRLNYYLNSPVFKKYCRSVRDFFIVGGLTLFTLMVLLVIIILFFLDGNMASIGSCGTPDCIDQ